MPEELRTEESGVVVSSTIERSEMPDVSANAEQLTRVEAEHVPGLSQENGELKLSSIVAQVKKVSGTAQTTFSATDDARDVSLLSDIESQVTRLLDLAVQKGIPHAVDVARKMKSYYLLDRMHDDMVDKFYQGLIDKGVIEKG